MSEGRVEVIAAALRAAGQNADVRAMLDEDGIAGNAQYLAEVVEARLRRIEDERLAAVESVSTRIEGGTWLSVFRGGSSEERP